MVRDYHAHNTVKDSGQPVTSLLHVHVILGLRIQARYITLVNQFEYLKRKRLTKTSTVKVNALIP